MTDHTTKTCTKCKCEFPPTIEYFTRDKRSKDGLGSWCRECSRAYAREYMRGWQKTEKGKAYRAQWFQKWYHEGDGKAYRQEWRSKPEQREKIRARAKEYGKEYRARPGAKERDRANSRRWQIENPEANAAKSRRYLARKRDAHGSHTVADVRKQYASQKGRCWWCGKQVGKKYHVDHVIPLARGGSDGTENIVIACPSCNTHKRDLLPQEWIGRLF